MRMPHGLRALAHRNFRVFIAGQGTAQIGNWLQLIATSWLMFRLTGSPLMVGLSTFMLQIPFLLLAPVAGVFLDRIDVRRVLYVTNAVALTQSFCMFALVATGAVLPWHLVAGNLVLGIVNACDTPARQSLLVKLVERREDLVNAIALNSSTMNGARFVGPMLGGMVIAALGEAWGFATNCVLRVVVLAALFRLRIPPRSGPRPQGSLVGQFVEGLQYVSGFLPTRCALLLLAATSITVQSYAPLLPWFASERFHGNSMTLGWLIGAGGLGAMSGMVHLALRTSVRGLFTLVGRSAMLAGIALVGFSLSHSLWLALPMLFLTAMGMMLTAAATNTVLQTIVPDHLRGRVASIYVVSFLGVSPLGALLGGWMGEHAGPPAALQVASLFTVLAAAAYMMRLKAIRREMAPVYDAMGIARRARHH